MQTVENERKEEKIMDSLQTRSAGRLSRVEAVTDPEVNRTLFEMYSSLVNPMVNIEKTLDDISETKSILIANEGDLSITLSEIVSLIYTFCLTNPCSSSVPQDVLIGVYCDFRTCAFH